MNKQEWEGRIIDYIDGKLTEKERVEIEEELIRNASLRLALNIRAHEYRG